MARLTINISDKLNKEMREYIEKNNLTITTFLHLAISRYIENETLWEDLFTELKEELRNNKKTK